MPHLNRSSSGTGDATALGNIDKSWLGRLSGGIDSRISHSGSLDDVALMVLYAANDAVVERPHEVAPAALHYRRDWMPPPHAR
jgi:hypothetical protein